MNIDEAISEYQIDQRVRGNSKNTAIYYGYALNKFKAIENINDVEQITAKVCKDYYIKLADSHLKSGAIQSYIRGLRAFLSWLYENDYIDIDIPHKFKLPKAQRQTIDVLTDNEIKLILGSFDNTYYGKRSLSIISLMFDSGLRLGEVVSFETDKLHLDERYGIVTGKGNKQRIIPIGKQSAETLTEYLRVKPKSKYLFVREDGTQITDTTIKNLFRDLKETTGIRRLHPHLLRHTFATRYLENGGNIYSLQVILGHTSLEMVKKYLHLATARIRTDFIKFSPFDNLNGTT